jgi:hypothetical protein
MATAIEPYSIPTKQGDDENERLSAMHHLVGESHHHPQEQDDAFSWYSNDFLRMKSLLLLSEDLEDGDDDGDDDLDALATINQARRSVGLSSLVHLNRDKRRRGNDSRRIQQGRNERKTRLSWEVHPDLILHDFILELEAALDIGTHRILDDEEDATEEQQSQVQEEEQEQEAPREEKK